MQTADNKRFVYEFGKFLLDPKEKTLFSDGMPVSLPAKEFETLLLLVENNGRALSKVQMMAAVWEDAFVEEGNLAKQISKLRKIFNSNGDRFIETLPKHGYRFSADLRRTYSESEESVILEKRTVKRLTVAYQDDAEDELLPAEVRRMQLIGNRHWVSLPGLLAAGVLLAVLLGAVSFLWVSSTSQEPKDASAIKSVAVLPFKPVGAEDSDEYLRLGLTDALITKLSNLKQILVRPTNAVRKYGDQDALAAGRELGVEAVLEGNVQRIGQQIRVTVQLVSVRDGRLL